MITMSEKQPALTYDDIAATATELLESGVVPTARLIHTKMGRGGMQTVQRHFDAWQIAIEEEEERKFSVTPEIESLLQDLSSRFFKKVWILSAEQEAESKKELQNKIEKLKEQNKSNGELLSESNNKIEEWESKFEKNKAQALEESIKLKTLLSERDKEIESLKEAQKSHQQELKAQEEKYLKILANFKKVAQTV